MRLRFAVRHFSFNRSGQAADDAPSAHFADHYRTRRLARRRNFGVTGDADRTPRTGRFALDRRQSLLLSLLGRCDLFLSWNSQHSASDALACVGPKKIRCAVLPPPHRKEAINFMRSLHGPPLLEWRPYAFPEYQTSVPLRRGRVVDDSQTKPFGGAPKRRRCARRRS